MEYTLGNTLFTYLRPLSLSIFPCAEWPRSAPSLAAAVGCGSAKTTAKAIERAVPAPCPSDAAATVTPTANSSFLSAAAAMHFQCSSVGADAGARLMRSIASLTCAVACASVTGSPMSASPMANGRDGFSSAGSEMASANAPVHPNAARVTWTETANANATESGTASRIEMILYMMCTKNNSRCPIPARLWERAMLARSASEAS